jgi:glutathione S-transferase
MNQSSFFTLYEYRISPFCIIIRLALNECNASFIARTVNLDKVRTIAFLKKSTFGRLPTLIEHHPSEEIIISESKAILIFLSERFSKSSLGFDNLQSKIQCLSWLNCIYSGFAEQIWNILSELYLFKKNDIRKNKLLEYFLELKYQMIILDKHLSKRPYLSGDYSIADTMATPFLDLLERIPNFKILSFFNILSWRQRIRNRPSYSGAWPL